MGPSQARCGGFPWWEGILPGLPGPQTTHGGSPGLTAMRGGSRYWPRALPSTSPATDRQYSGALPPQELSPPGLWDLEGAIPCRRSGPELVPQQRPRPQAQPPMAGPYLRPGRVPHL